MAIEKIRTARNDREVLSQRPVEKTTALDQILPEHRQQRLFGDFLEREGNVALAKALAERSLTTEQLMELEAARAQFMQIMQQAGRNLEALTPENVERIGEKSDDMRRLLGLVGPAPLSRMWSAQMYELAVREPDEFDRLSEALNPYLDARDDADLAIFDVAAKAGINDDEYARIIAMADTSKRRADLRKLAHAQYGRFKRAMDVGGIISRLDARDLEAEGRRIADRGISRMDAAMSSIGSVLAGSLSRNKEVRDAFTREMVGDDPIERNEMAFRQGQESMPTEQTVLNAWSMHKPDTFASMDAAAQEDARDLFLRDFQSRYTETMKARKGFWATIFLSVFGGMAANIDKGKLT